ncbi:hypothetical protein [Roseibium alexandrii]|uniref:Uncharacterized protein n=1 Tax=Roseibium alexandrii TaxID=388408 RepID=A0A0M7AM26_9HYPH|nr:hypothetical protein [Roseibium alexandrii]CTQ75492.1 hypothetical protein LAX5112_04259 [Roseibium alexandrii]
MSRRDFLSLFISQVGHGRMANVAAAVRVIAQVLIVIAKILFMVSDHNALGRRLRGAKEQSVEISTTPLPHQRRIIYIHSMRQKRDKDYYLKRLKAEHPTEYAQVQTGRQDFWNTVYDVGLKRRQKPVNTLKGAWKRCSATDKREFLDWLRSEHGIQTKTSSVSRVTTSPFSKAALPELADSQGRLSTAAIAAISDTMQKLDMKSGDLMKEIGERPLDQSVGSALRRPTRIKNAILLAKLKRWLKKHGYQFL